MLPRGPIVLLLSVMFSWGCGSEPSRPARSRAPLLGEVDSQARFESPATWRYHPPAEARLLVRHGLDKSRALFAGEKGERWLIQKGKPARAAARLAPEPLIAILQTESGWMFVGRSGTSYESDVPLGAFVRSSAPLDRVTHVAAAGNSIAGIREDGRLVHSADLGTTWEPVGPEGDRFVDLSLLDSGVGLALSVPEQLWITRDDGSTWKRLGGAAFGASGLELDQDAGVVVTGALVRKKLSKQGKLLPLDRKVKPRSYTLGTDPPRGPDAAALREGRALILGDRYFELAKTGTVGDGWELIVGPVAGRLRIRALGVPKSCRQLRLAGFRDVMELGCASKSSSSVQDLTFYRSEDGGKKWKLEPFEAVGRFADLRLAVGAKGALLATGLCSARNQQRGCRPEGVYFRGIDDDPEDAGSKEATSEDDEGSLSLLPSATPALRGSASRLAFSYDGRVAYATGVRSKNGVQALFVSNDGGEKFQARELGAESSAQLGGRPSNSHSSSGAAQRVRTLQPAEDGTVGILTFKGSQSQLVVTDDEGRVISVASAPEPGAELSIVGSRAFAFSNRSREAWESLDGGASWESVGGVPLRLCGEGSKSCSSGIFCHVGGCVLGDVLSRIGWRGQSDVDSGVVARGDARRGGVFDRQVRTPLVCAVGEDPWQTVAGLDKAPTAGQAAVGDVDWFGVSGTDQDTSVTALHGRPGKRKKRPLVVDRVVLFGPARAPQKMAYYYTLQVEGSAALRYPQADARGNIQNVEVAWDNRLEGKVSKARLPDAGRFRAGDYQRIAGAPPQRARPDLLSVAQGGIYLRLHNLSRDRQTTYFLDGKSVTSIGEMRWPTPLVSKATRRTEMAHIGSAHVPLLLLGSGAVALRGEPGRGATAAYSTGPIRPGVFGLGAYRNISYVGGGAGWHVQLHDKHGRQARAWVFPFQATGPVVGVPVPVPTLLDFGDEPKPCSKVARKGTARLVVPHLAGTRHPIIVTSPAEPPRVLLSDRAVIHGSRERPCMAALDAHVVKTELWEQVEDERAIIMLDHLDKAWLFRRRAKVAPVSPVPGLMGAMGRRGLGGISSGARVLEVRSMSCQFDTNADVPFEVYQQAGTRVQRR